MPKVVKSMRVFFCCHQVLCKKMHLKKNVFPKMLFNDSQSQEEKKNTIPHTKKYLNGNNVKGKNHLAI